MFDDEATRAYLASQRRKHAKAASEGETFWVRLQFNLAKRLDVASHHKDFRLAGRRVRLAAFERGAILRDSDRVVFTARRFATKEEADQFGRAVQRAIVISSLALNLGADVGVEAKPTSHISQDFAKLDPALTGFYIRTTSQGVNSYSSHEETLFVNVSATAVVITKPQALLRGLQRFFEASASLDDGSFVAAVLMNDSMMNLEPHSKLLLSIAAVETLAQPERWNAAQSDALTRLKDHAGSLTGLNDDELREVVEAVVNLRNFGVNAKCRRLIREVGLTSLLPRWNKLYSERSQIVHGLRYATPQQAGEIANAARDLCARIVIAAITRHVKGLGDVAEGAYPAID